jgi:hypothetical protein
MIIDRKFKFIAVNPCKNTVYTQEDAIVFCAKDKAVPAMLLEYIDRCKYLECGEDHIESMGLLLERVLEFQKNVESRVPDTELSCEIDRCIGGKNL